MNEPDIVTLLFTKQTSNFRTAAALFDTPINWHCVALKDFSDYTRFFSRVCPRDTYVNLIFFSPLKWNLWACFLLFKHLELHTSVCQLHDYVTMSTMFYGG